MSQLRLVDPLGERPLQPGDLPLTVGGPGSAIVLPGLQPGERLATLGASDGRLFVEPAPDAALRLDGARLGASGWMDDGSVLDLGAGLIRIESREGVRSIVVEHEAVGNVTLPPLFEGQPLESAADGGDSLRSVAALLTFLRWGRRVLAG